MLLLKLIHKKHKTPEVSEKISFAFDLRILNMVNIYIFYDNLSLKMVKVKCLKTLTLKYVY